MARDPETTVKVWSGDAGYPGDEHYLEFHKQLYPGQDQVLAYLAEQGGPGAEAAVRPLGGVREDRLARPRSWSNDAEERDGAKYRGQEPTATGTLVAMYDTELFGHWWWEGPEFLYELGGRSTPTARSRW